MSLRSCGLLMPASVLLRVLADEAIAVGHLHLRQGLRVHDVGFTDDLVEREDIGGQRIDLAVGERLRRLPRHRATGEVEDGSGIGPVVADQLLRLAILGIERTAADQRPAHAAGTLLTVTGAAAAFGIYLLALRGGSAAGRQPGAVGRDADVPGRNVG